MVPKLEFSVLLDTTSEILLNDRSNSRKEIVIKVNMKKVLPVYLETSNFCKMTLDFIFNIQCTEELEILAT